MEEEKEQLKCVHVGAEAEAEVEQEKKLLKRVHVRVEVGVAQDQG